MSQFVLTARNTIPLGNGGLVEQGRKIIVSVNALGTTKDNIFQTVAGKNAVALAFGQQGIPATSNFMSTAKWEIKPFMIKF